ncbi:MAG: hypothetical protein EOR52_18810 [Mesorhizobium sp.]|nr:MAG: hypothetical protein EOR52_18810 [Mesorhizobium sp.]
MRCLVRDQLGGGPLAYGALMAGFGTGAVFAGVSNGVFRRRLSQERLMTLACIACAACSLSLALTSSIAVAAIALALGGAGWVIAWSGVGERADGGRLFGSVSYSRDGRLQSGW